MPTQMLRKAEPIEATRVFIRAWMEDEDCEVRKYLRQLRENGDGDLGRLAHLFKAFAESGIVYNEEKFKDLGDGVFEFKAPGGARIGCFFGAKEKGVATDHAVLILTHGFHKPTSNKAYAPHKKRVRAIEKRYKEEQEQNHTHSNDDPPPQRPQRARRG